jgi:aminopeptidase 2
MNQLTLRDCVGISCDLKSLVAAGLNKTSELLDLSLGLTKLDSYLIWEIIDRNLRAVQSSWDHGDHSIQTALRKAIVDIIGSKAHELGWSISDDEESTKIAFKASMFSTAGLAGDRKYVTFFLEPNYSLNVI